MYPLHRYDRRLMDEPSDQRPYSSQHVHAGQTMIAQEEAMVGTEQCNIIDDLLPLQIPPSLI